MNGKSYDVTNSGSEMTRCGNCGRMIRTNASETEKGSIPLRFLLYPIPIFSYVFMIALVKRFCCPTCKEEYEARHPKAWRSAFWWVHGIFLGIPALLIILAIFVYLQEHGFSVPQ